MKHAKGVFVIEEHEAKLHNMKKEVLVSKVLEEVPVQQVCLTLRATPGLSVLLINPLLL